MKDKNSSNKKIEFKLETCNILGVNINVTNMKSTVSYITENLDSLKGDYICVSNVHTTVMAYEDKKYMKIQNSAAMALPDGKPLSIVSKKRGYKEAERVTGPDLMEQIFKISKENNYKHYFYGSTEETLELLKKNLNNKYPEINIVGVYSPPFRKLTDQEIFEIEKKINDSNADFVWVGLGAPKQEIWMYENRNKINSLMIGVGAGFDYHAGNIKRAPIIMRNLSLEWLYRLMQDPKRLFKRYFFTNIKFIKLIFKEKWSF
ncbi:WecB/TagA/CpsF family glycosyltransferase [Clostridium perfringens]|uniref:WecB/TagA/CpsF family glycosyltransferase n=1 Tax=Clostridium perfringens TaxID=1502 RepID=UPI001A1A49FB|nr:WecB/TagA/CpsF family glycosyltransferase [Clostridium perfringens]MDK0893270.1 WecB/TagA/CpsF family glycosyltransferase [Clostridium perfringens]MDT7984933.1 WecB/TagA/CpsF family glycosyltransferase [Clostridium perfringens]MDT8040354.1 WecB/TagA/CpsF family glycosyltransferase [Clostridium perfringens]MDZ5037219.1 WecB/TagA/CpsF family glycosyltransferase [Clostridium perfringens]HAT4174598.1 WecB/TagA/CpsF family glycosyltransferase [Clostridium perfringens]